MLRSQEQGLAWMRGQGFSVAATSEAVSLPTSFVVGHCIEEQARRQAPDDRYSLEARDRRVDAAAHPLVAQSGRTIFDDDPDGSFERMLTIVLDGLAATRRPPAQHDRDDG